MCGVRRWNFAFNRSYDVVSHVVGGMVLVARFIHLQYDDELERNGMEESFFFGFFGFFGFFFLYTGK